MERSLLKIAILDSVYWGVLKDAGLEALPEGPTSAIDNNQKLQDLRVGTGSVYKFWFQQRGHNCTVIYGNARGATSRFDGDLLYRVRNFLILWKYWQLISRIPIIGPALYERSAMAKSIIWKIIQEEPEILLVLNINLLTHQMQKLIAQAGIKIVGQHASPLPPKSFFSQYELIYTAHPGLVEKFRKTGIDCRFVPLALDDSFLNPYPSQFGNRRNDLVFVGSFSRHYKGSAGFFRAISKIFTQLKIYTVTNQFKLRIAGLSKHFAGNVWGKRMMDTYSDSKIVVNRHIKMADGYAVNYRMFEATGSGALLLTEEAPNLADLFQPGEEVLTYASTVEAIEKIKWALENPDQASRIASAGYERTRREHLTGNRIHQIETLLEEQLPTS
jgi:glycosyltransferase involved in cell wall biosynthesis